MSPDTTDQSRLDQLHRWLEPLAGPWSIDPSSLEPASRDASFRRYFRASATHPEHPTLIIMDAPPPQEDCRPFVHVADLLAGTGVNVPAVLAQDLENGFLLLGDLGTTTYLQALNQDTASALYSDACDALIRIQRASRDDALPPYDRALLLREMELFPDWYVSRHLGAMLTGPQQADLKGVFEVLIRNCLAQPQVWVHRDYHSRNLMVTGRNNPGILDFQDAVCGPITYDLVSLFRDAYISWDEEQQIDWLVRYWDKARKAGLPVTADFGEFYRDFEWMGLQRHLKVVGIFARLCHRDGKDGYLKDMPLVLEYMRRVTHRYREFATLARLLDALEGIDVAAGYTF